MLEPIANTRNVWKAAPSIGQVDGPTRGLAQIEGITDRERLAAYPFYYAAIGEFELRCGRYAEARGRFEKAKSVARNPMELNFLQWRLRLRRSRDVRAASGMTPGLYRVYGFPKTSDMIL